MTTPRKPREHSSGPDPATLTLAPGKESGSGFGGVQGDVTGTESQAGGNPFAAVRSVATSTEASPATRTYAVRPGDTLSHIAQAHYGKAGLWTRIYDANRDLLDDPDLIHPGQVLRIPAADR
jgi:nucleoid-associated protein YgaU